MDFFLKTLEKKFRNIFRENSEELRLLMSKELVESCEKTRATQIQEKLAKQMHEEPDKMKINEERRLLLEEVLFFNI